MLEFLQQAGVDLVQAVPDPGNDGGNNDHAYYLWIQTADAPTMPKSCNPKSPPDLMNDGKTNGWPTIDGAIAVLKKHVANAEQIARMVAESVAQAEVDAPEKALKAGAKELAGDVGQAAAAVGNAAASAATATPWWVKLGAGVLVAVGIGYAVRSVR